MFNKKNKEYKYSIRKYSVGVASVAVAACLFLGGAAHAQEGTEGRVPVPPGTVETETRTVDYVTMESNRDAMETTEETVSTPTPVPTAPMRGNSGNVTTNGGKSGTTIDWGDNEREEENRQVLSNSKNERTDEIDSKKLQEIKEAVKKGIEERTKLSKTRKEHYKGLVDSALSFDAITAIINDFEEEDLSLDYDELKHQNRGIQSLVTAINEELDYQRKHIEKLLEKKAITIEEKNYALERLESIKKETEAKVQMGDKNTLEQLWKEVISEIAKIKLERKAIAEKEIVEYANEKINEEMRKHSVSETIADEELQKKHPDLFNYKENIKNEVRDSLARLSEVITNDGVEKEVVDSKILMSKINLNDGGKYLYNKKLLESKKELQEMLSKLEEVITNGVSILSKAELEERKEYILIQKKALDLQQESNSALKETGDDLEKLQSLKNQVGEIIEVLTQQLSAIERSNSKENDIVDVEKEQSDEGDFMGNELSTSREDNNENKLGVQEKTLKDKFLEKLKSELDYQRENAEKLSKKLAITDEEKEAALKKIEEIKVKAEKEAEGKDANTIESVIKEVLASLGELKFSKKSSAEQQIVEYANQKINVELMKEGSSLIADDADLKKKHPDLFEYKMLMRKEVQGILDRLAKVTKNNQVEQIVKESKMQLDKVKIPSPYMLKIEKGLSDAEKLKERLEEVDKHKPYPMTHEYSVQKKIWEQGKDVAPKKIEDFKKITKKKDLTEKELDDAIDDLIYYQIHAQIEALTRRVAEYREKYPKNEKIEKEFSDYIKQTDSDNYGTLEGKVLKSHFNTEFYPSFERIQKIVKEIEEKKSSEDKMLGDKAPETPGKTMKQDLASLKKSVEEKVKLLKRESETVPSGVKLVGEASEIYKKKAKEGEELVKKTEELLAKKDVTERELAEKLTEVNNAISELKEAEGNLPKSTSPSLDNSTPKVEEKTSEDREAKTPELKEEPKNTEKEVAPKPEIKEESKDMSKDEDKVEEKTPEAPTSKEQPKDNANREEKPTSPVIPENQGDNKPQTPKQPEMKQEPKEMDKKSTEKDAPKVILETKEFKLNGIKVELNKDVDANELSANKVEESALIEKVKKELSVDNVRIFDLNLLKDGKVTNPNVERTVRIALVEGENNAKIYHVKEDNTLEEIPSTIEGNEIVFKTNHFSMYAVVSKKDNATAGKEKQLEMDKEKAKETDKKTSEMASASSKDGKALPNTSSANNGIIAGVVGLILGLLALVRRVCVK